MVSIGLTPGQPRLLGMKSKGGKGASKTIRGEGKILRKERRLNQSKRDTEKCERRTRRYLYGPREGGGRECTNRVRKRRRGKESSSPLLGKEKGRHPPLTSTKKQGKKSTTRPESNGRLVWGSKGRGEVGVSKERIAIRNTAAYKLKGGNAKK